MKLKDLFESTGKSVADLGIEYEGGNLDCNNDQLTSLEGAPSRVGGYFTCVNNRLTSLKGAPSYVHRGFSCANNQLISLEGAPSRVGSDFYCSNNQLTSLKDVHRYIAEIQGNFFAFDNPIKSHVLGLLLIKGITEIHIDNMQVEEILNRHLNKGRAGMLQAQEELIESGLEEFAQL